IELLNRSISYKPTNDSYFERAWVYLDLKRYNLALQDFKAALASSGNKKLFDIKASLSYCYYLLGRYRACIALANEALTEQPDLILAIYYRGWAFLMLKEWDAALQDFEHVAKANPRNPQGFYALHLVFFHKGNFPKALEYINYALELQNDNVQYWERKAIVLHKLGRKEEMLSIIEQIIRQPSQNQATWKLIGDLFLDNQEYTLAVEYYNKAIEIYHQELAKDPKYRELQKEQMHNVYLSRGKAYRALGNMAQALGDFAQALDFKDDSYLAYNQIGALQSQKKNYWEAIEAYSRCFTLKGDYLEGWEKWGEAYLYLNRPQEAINILSKALKLEDVSQKAQILSLRGKSYLLLKDTNKALKDFEEALSEDPELPSAHIGLGELFLSQGNYPEAIKKLEYALSIENISPEEKETALLKKAVAHAKLQQFQLALRELEKASQINPENVEILENLGIVYYHFSDYCQALTYLEKARNITLAQRKTESTEAQTTRRKILTNHPNPCK
ncbi:MAG: tetratricopeptide repeat protein, partial [Bacteroidia bacterium]|nr:tetratricopeptide repeat protein [Bacteroidia bacterium]MDW8158728.1 tetratricopeptide repeat protein [Bacteroidia bacterium]